MGGPKGVPMKTYSKEFKLEAVRRMKTCETISSLAAELGVARRFLYKWREQLQTEGEEALARKPGQPRSKEQLAASAKRVRPWRRRRSRVRCRNPLRSWRRLGAKQLEIDFFRCTFEHVRGVMQNPEKRGEKPSITES